MGNKKKIKRNSFSFLLRNKDVFAKLIGLGVVTVMIIVLFFFLVFFSHITKSSDMFLIEVKEFFSNNFWLPFVFFIIWGFFVIRISYLISVKKLTAPFNRFQKHMDEMTENKEKDFFVHRTYDHHMVDIVGSFNKLIDNLFDEIENRQSVIHKLRDTINDIYKDKTLVDRLDIKEALDTKEYHE